jgi:hypothetical protein
MNAGKQIIRGLEDSPMKKTDKTGYRTFGLGGGIVGLVTFLALGLLPSIVYGGFAGVTLASAILGGPVDSSLFARGLVVAGMVVGLLGTAAIFVVIGAALGSGVYSLARSFARAPAEEHDDAVEHKA